MDYANLFRAFGATTAADALAEGADKHFCSYGITGIRLAHWLGQFAHESAGFSKFVESLNYSAERLCKVWPSRFPTLKSALPYARNPEALANKVYMFRMGNDEPGDGWKYRGRGPHLTGKENYTAAQERTGLPLVSQPDLAADPANFVLLACDYWASRNCNAAADADNLVLVTKKINGGSIGIQERRQLVLKAKRLLGC
jgi:putative chitinase